MEWSVYRAPIVDISGVEEVLGMAVGIRVGIRDGKETFPTDDLVPS